MIFDIDWNNILLATIKASLKTCFKIIVHSFEFEKYTTHYTKNNLLFYIFLDG